MTAIAGIFRNGRVELVGPIPDWADGTAVTVMHPEPTDEIDITGDSPEAIAAWIAWYDRLHKSNEDSTFPEELERNLAESKVEQLKSWEEHGKRIEGLFP